MSADIPEEFLEEEGNEVVAGRQPPPFTQSPDWVSLADINPLAGKLHTHLMAHVNQNRGDTKVWPTTRALARMLKLPRRDRVSPLLKELKQIGALDYKRQGIPARNVYIVHSMPPEGYTGPLTLADWYARNRKALDEEAAADKAVREARKQGKAPAKTTGKKPQVSAVTHPEGQLADPTEAAPVTHTEGQLGTHPEGQPVTPAGGRKQELREQDEENNQNPPADADAEKPHVSVQTTIDGKGEQIAPRAEAPEDRAFGIARSWMAYRAEQRKPVAGAKALTMLKSLVLPFIVAEYTDKEIKHALNALGEGLPSRAQMQRTLDTIRDGGQPTTTGRPRQRGGGADVNGYWDRQEQAAAEASPDSGTSSAAPKTAAVQTTGAYW